MDINELCDRYGIASKKTLYRRLTGIDLELNKENGKVAATREQIEMLDDHISRGGTTSNFVPLSQSEVVSSSRHNETQLGDVSETRHTTTQLKLTPEIIELFVELTPSKDPLYNLIKLQKASQEEWELTTSQVAQLIGVKPQTKGGESFYIRGSFIFEKVGKIGCETAWRVKRKDGRIEKRIDEINQQE